MFAFQLTVQVQSYFSRFPNDAKWVKAMVGFLWCVSCFLKIHADKLHYHRLVDFAHQICTSMISYDYTVCRRYSFCHIPAPNGDFTIPRLSITTTQAI